MVPDSKGHQGWGDRCGREAGAGRRGGQLAEGQGAHAGADGGSRCALDKQGVTIGGKSSLAKANIADAQASKSRRNANVMVD